MLEALTPAQVERLALLIEECSEVQYEACKVLRHGYFSKNPNDEKAEITRDNLIRELGDLTHVIQRLIDAGDLSAAEIDTHAFRKADRIKSWLHHIPENPKKPEEDDKCLCYGRGCNKCEPQGRG